MIFQRRFFGVFQVIKGFFTPYSGSVGGLKFKSELPVPEVLLTTRKTMSEYRRLSNFSQNHRAQWKGLQLEVRAQWASRLNLSQLLNRSVKRGMEMLFTPDFLKEERGRRSIGQLWKTPRVARWRIVPARW